MSVFTHPDFDHHEQVVFCHDKASGLRAIIAIHDTTLGPALGGCRMFPYASDDDAVRDVLRLSRGMTLKSSLAGLKLGGANDMAGSLGEGLHFRLAGARVGRGDVAPAEAVDEIAHGVQQRLALAGMRIADDHRLAATELEAGQRGLQRHAA